MSDHSARALATKVDGVWQALSNCGYALTDDETIGLPEKFRENFGPAYFNDQILRHDDGDRPIDRTRARDVIRYRWRDDALELEEHDTITITDRAGIQGKRDHARIRLLDDPHAEELVRVFLRMIPPERRQLDGTFGVNLFRTFTNVVSAPHHDNEEFIIIYVISRTGGGAETYLYQPEDVPDGYDAIADPLFRHQLNPGQIVVFEDKLFRHGTTPLEPPPGEKAVRDALVCTVDYPSTYLQA